MCIDFRNLNQDSLEDNYPLPNMEYLLQRVTRVEMMSMIDGFSGYNQVLVKEDMTNSLSLFSTTDLHFLLLDSLSFS
jgi:hypothetical protein